MRILVVTNLYPPQELGGYGRSLADFAWGLQGRGHRIVVACSDAPYLGAAAHGPSGEPVNRCLQLKGSFQGGVSLNQDPQRCGAIDAHNRHAVRELLQRGDFQGILLGNLDLLGVELLSAVLEPGVPVLHHVGFMVSPFPAALWPTARHYTLVAASLAVRQALHQQGLPVAQAPVVYPGARTELFGTALQRPGPPPSQGVGTPANPLKLAFAGLLMASKGAHTAVEAVARLQQSGVAVQLNLAGNEFQHGYWQALEAFSNRAGLDGLVRWVGPLGRPQLSRFLALHHAGIFPSIYPEAFGIVGAEMQASGLALVSSSVGGAAELLAEGSAGLPFTPGDANHLHRQLLRLVREPGLLDQLRSTGQRLVREQFSVTAAAAQLEQLWLQSAAQAASSNAANLGSMSR